MELVAAGTPANTVAPKIAEREAGIREVDARLRRPRVPKLSTEKLRAALEQRAKEWKRELRSEPGVARLLLRRLVGPIVLHDEAGAARMGAVGSGADDRPVGRAGYSHLSFLRHR
jgi:hypothetical protein